MRVLLVEDDRTIGDFVEKGLRQAGFAVDRAADGLGDRRRPSKIVDGSEPG